MTPSTTPPTVVNEPGVDSSFFYFPPIDEAQGRPALGAGDMFMMFNDRDEVRAVMEFLTTPEAAEQWIATGSFVSPNTQVAAGLVQRVPGLRTGRDPGHDGPYKFDASDLMPAEVGQRTLVGRHG